VVALGPWARQSGPHRTKTRDAVALVAAQCAEQGPMSGTLPNHDEAGATDDKDLSPWYDYRPRENDRLSGEWACHEGTLDDDALREEGPLLHKEGPLPEKWSAPESETAARDDLPMPSSEPGARDDLAMPSGEGA
jgi:hypothetical protein